MTKLVWRLGKLPTVEELLKLVNDKILTHDEAKEILFKNETEEDRDKKSLESEIKFLRELVERLSSRKQIVEVVKEVKHTYESWPWYSPYYYWCTTTPSSATYTVTNTGGVTGSDCVGGFTGTSTVTAGVANSAATGAINNSFSSISTF